ncbi:MAG: DUF3656 domain-containing protein [Bacteroidaceae bacterium]
MTSIELLSPAQDLDCGMAAVDHGADAVYIGAPRYGARAAAGNSVEDILRLCQYARPYGVRIYVTLNTILFEEDLEDTRRLVWDLYHAGVDALIVQDLALLEMDLPPVALHASTQMDNRTVTQVRWLQSLGFQQTVLARELSLEQIGEIHRQVPGMSLEAFVHGALCVSYSGRCYASQYCFGRSANRGECAQFCRLPFTLSDARGQMLTSRRHLLSLRDMNRMDCLEEMMDAGVRSFKIEGRLKGVSYVKNVTAAYRQAIDRVLCRRSSDYVRSSLGSSQMTFSPDPQRSFSRGFTDYFLHGRQGSVASMDTPKSRGMEVGRVREVTRDSIVVSGSASFANGDGLCFVDAEGQLCGFRVNRVQDNRLFPSTMPPLRRGDVLWRNYDQVWERKMAGPTARRTIGLEMLFEDVPEGFRLTLTREDGVRQTFSFPYGHQLARSPQTESICQALMKTGDTVYACTRVEVVLSQPWFVPRSLLTRWRRDALDAFAGVGRPETRQGGSSSVCKSSAEPVPADGQADAHGVRHCTYQSNIANHLARRFYERHGFRVDEMAMECGSGQGQERLLMTCRHCLKYELGWCRKYGGTPLQAPEPLYLNLSDGRRFRLEFDCRRCEMKVWNA